MAGTDWALDLPRGSFRGVPFWFSVDAREGGRRLAVHEFPGAERGLVEDLGRSTARWPLTAYVTNQIAADALWAAATAPGPGLLWTATFGGVLVRCETIRESHDKSELGRIALDLGFVEEPQVTLAGFSVLSASGLLAGAVAAVTAGVTAGLSVLIGGVAATVVGTLSGIYRGAAVVIEAAATGALWGMVDATAGALATVALPSAVARDVLDGLAVARRVAASPGAAFGRVTGAIRAALDALEDEAAGDVAATVARALTVLPPETEEPWSKSRKAAREIRRAGEVALATLAAATVMRREALGSWTSRGEATEARERIRALHDGLAEPVGLYLGEAAAVALTDLRNQAIAVLTRRITTLAPVVRVDTGTSLSAVRISYELYGTPGRAREIIRRNAAATPAIMPTRLEVLQP